MCRHSSGTRSPAKMPDYLITRKKWVDEVLTLAGDLDRHVIGTRRSDPQGILRLV